MTNHLQKLRQLILGSKIAIFYEFQKPPYGGGNQFLLALKSELEKLGVDVGANSIGPLTQSILFNSYNFDASQIETFAQGHYRMIHRVDGPISVYRGYKSDIDIRIWELNQKNADITVFQSDYSYQKHLDFGLKFLNPVVIPNAADPDIFNPLGRKLFDPKADKIKIIAASWSDNFKKGAATYEWLDKNLDHSKFEFTFVGRLPTSLKNSKVIPAISSQELANLYRSSDIYLTASQDDPCSNALIEALSCGLPAVYLNSGGHPGLIKSAGLGFETREEIPFLLEKLSKNYTDYQSKIDPPSIKDVALKYAELMLDPKYESARSKRRSQIFITRDSGKVSINLRPVDTSWGGGNQFSQQITQYLKSRGYRVSFELDSDISNILMIDPRPSESVMYGVDKIREFKKARPDVKCIHRINECDQRKSTDYMDRVLMEANQVADYTIFISEWLKDYFSKRWFKPELPHCVIHNGANSDIFYPREIPIHMPEVLNIVTHHWSSNWMKGFGVYKEIDDLIYQKKIKGFQLNVIGRWPNEIEWKSAKTHAPANGETLANLLRQNHLYVTASLWEPCGMHHIEGAQCGLPLIYHADGGGINEFGKRYGLEFRDNIDSVLIEARERYFELAKKVREFAPSGVEMCKEYERILFTMTT